MQFNKLFFIFHLNHLDILKKKFIIFNQQDFISFIVFEMVLIFITKCYAR